MEEPYDGDGDPLAEPIHEEKRMTLGEHLEELRSHVVRSLFWVALIFGVSLLFQDQLLTVVTYPHRVAANAIDHDRLLDHFSEQAPKHDPEVAAELSDLVRNLRRAKQQLGSEEARVTGALDPDEVARLRAEATELLAEQEKVLAALRALADGKPERPKGEHDGEEPPGESPPPGGGGEGEGEGGEPPVPPDPERAKLVERAIALQAQLTETQRKLERTLPPQREIESPDGAAAQLQVLSYPEAFLNYIKVCLVASLILGTPFVGFEAWRFVRAGLYPTERKWVTIFAPMSLAPFVTGVCFGYFIMIPVGLRYLGSYGGPEIVRMSIRLGDYLSFFILLTMVTGLIFELPLIMCFITLTGIIGPDQFRAYRKFFIIGALVFSAFLTPPDVTTQIMLGIPLAFLYEIGILASVVIVKRRRKRQGTEQLPM